MSKVIQLLNSARFMLKSPAKPAEADRLIFEAQEAYKAEKKLRQRIKKEMMSKP